MWIVYYTNTQHDATGNVYISTEIKVLTLQPLHGIQEKSSKIVILRLPVMRVNALPLVLILVTTDLFWSAYPHV